MRRNWRIELIRIIATFGIAIFHFEWIYVGQPIYFQHFYLWVEFFFVLSGFFLARNCKQYGDAEWGCVDYSWNQVKKLWPPYFVAFVFSFVVYCICNNVNDLKNIFSLLWKTKWEIVFLQLSGFDGAAPMINGVTAYVPALLISGLVLTYLLKYHYRLTINVIAPIGPILIYSHILIKYGNLSQWMAYENWVTVGVFRGIAGTLLGVMAFELGGKCHLNAKLLRIFRAVCILLILALIVFRDSITYQDEAIYPYVFALLLWGIYYDEANYKIPQLLERLILYLGRISYNIFLLHYGVCHLFSLYAKDGKLSYIVPTYFVVTVLLAVLMDRFIYRVTYGKKVRGCE